MEKETVVRGRFGGNPVLLRHEQEGEIIPLLLSAFPSKGEPVATPAPLRRVLLAKAVRQLPRLL